MSLSHAKFIDALSQVGLLAAAEIETLKAAAVDKLQADADVLARELVEQGKLTRFQAAAIYQGRAEALVLGNYLVIDKLGAGGMGQVFRARHRRMDRVVALKVLSKKQVGSPDAVARFQREVKAAARLTHPHIVTAHDADEAAGLHYLVMEYVDGQDLSATIKSQGPMKVAQAVDCIIQAARGLEHAHGQGVIHRDVKPSNLLLDKHGTVKILDMGLARVDNALSGPDSDEGLTAAGSIMGTIDFMSPEQALDTARVDARTDIYSLGCTLYFLLAGKKPYDGDTVMKKILAHREQPIPSLAQARPEVPADLDAVYRKLVAKRADERYATMHEAREALEAVQAGRRPMGIGTAASPVPLSPRIGEGSDQPDGRKNHATKVRSKVPLVVSSAAILLLGLGGWIAMKTTSNQPERQVAAADSGARQPAGSPAPQPARSASQPAKSAVPEPRQPKDVAGNSEPEAAGPMTAAVNEPQGAPAGSGVDSIDTAAENGLTTEPSPGSTESAALAPADPGAERRAAQWALSVGSKLRVKVGNGPPLEVARVEQLPPQPFAVNSIEIRDNPAVNDQSLAVLRGLRRIQKLHLTKTSVTDQGVAQLRDLKTLINLGISMTDVGDAGIQQLADLPHLVLLSANSTPITDRGLLSMTRLTSLRTLHLAQVKITDDGLATLAKLPLTVLAVDDNSITDAGLKNLQPCATLDYLLVNRTQVTDAGLDFIAKMPALHRLELRSDNITDRGAETLAAMKSLTHLDLSETQVTRAGYEKLRAALPNCTIAWSERPASAVAVAAPASSGPADMSQRLAVPSDDEQQKAATLVKEVFGEELGQAKKPDEKVALANKLVAKALEIRDDPTSAYVMLDLARGLAVDAGDVPLLAKINRALGSQFEVEPQALLADDLEKSAQKPHLPAGFRAISEFALEQLDDLLAADDYALAKRLSDVAVVAARKSKDPSMVKAAVDRSKSIAAARHEWEAAEAARAVLAATPDDPEANLALGRYLCFVKGDWSAGFANLAKSSDPTLKQLAAKSATDPQDAVGQIALGEAWADAAATAKSKSKADLQAGARYWLSKAQPTATGLVKAKIEQQLKRLGPREPSDARSNLRPPAPGSPPTPPPTVFNRPGAQPPLAPPFAKRLHDAIAAGRTFDTPRSGAGDTIIRDVPEEGALLVGLIMHWQDEAKTKIRGITPVYLTSRGEARGHCIGQSGAPNGALHSKNGYAVGGLECSKLFAAEGISVRYMRNTNDGLNPADNYAASVRGGKPNPSPELRLGLDGSYVIGITGSVSDSGQISSLGLVLVK